jgi:hypothetical protein
MMDPWLIKFLGRHAAQRSMTNGFQSMDDQHDGAIAPQ